MQTPSFFSIFLMIFLLFLGLIMFFCLFFLNFNFFLQNFTIVFVNTPTTCAEQSLIYNFTEEFPQATGFDLDLPTTTASSEAPPGCLTSGSIPP